MRHSDTHGLCVPYSVRTTPDKGRGLFSESNIHKGTTVWRHIPGQYAVYDEQTLKAHLFSMSHSEAVYELTHIFCMEEFPGFMIKVFDDGELINHSEQPTLITNTDSGYYNAPPVTSAQDVANTLKGGHFTLLAARDIEVGEELTLDYNTDPEEPPYYTALWEQYGLSWDWI